MIKSLRIVLGLLLLALFAFKADRSSSENWPIPQLFFFPPLPADFKTPSTAQVELGRYLFYDPILSANGKISCAHCHQQEYAFADGNKRFSRGVSGRELNRNTPGLFNLVWQQSFFWDGRASSLQEQAFFPVRHSLEMNLKWPEAENRIRQSEFYPALFEKAYPGKEIDSSLICQALADFQSILFSQDSKYDRVLRGEDHFTALEYQGYTLANLQDKGDCMQCHITDAHALGTSGDFSNNGLDSARRPMDYVDKGQIEFRGQDRNGWFKIPSLRNVALTAPYMHDGRFKTLEEVIDFYSEGLARPYNVDSKLQHAHKGGVHLSDPEKKALLAFLHTLTDSVFIKNPAFANPFSN